MAAKTFRSWEVTRSGSGQVVHGTNIATGEVDKITGIAKIVPPDNPALHEVIALARDGTRHRLIFNN